MLLSVSYKNKVVKLKPIYSSSQKLSIFHHYFSTYSLKIHTYSHGKQVENKTVTSKGTSSPVLLQDTSSPIDGEVIQGGCFSQYSSRIPSWTLGSSCRPAGTGTRQRVSVPPARPRVGGLRWFHAEPSLICSSARGTDPSWEK